MGTNQCSKPKWRVRPHDQGFYQTLCQDPTYMNNLKRACEIVASAWGWDLTIGQRMHNPRRQVYAIRWYKMVYCLANFNRWTNSPPWVRNYYRQLTVDFVRGGNGFDRPFVGFKAKQLRKDFRGSK